MKYILIIIMLFPANAISEESVCYGTTSNGYLEDGVKLPSEGNNYVGYSNLARLLGRTYVHSSVKEIIVNTYKRLETEQPGKVYKYAETGFKDGGKFKPHKTHKNGLSVDFMTPVKDLKGNSVHLPTNPFNKFGYSIEFDRNGKLDDLEIDFEAMAAHITFLHKEAKRLGYDLWHVIFDPKLQSKLYQTKYSEYLRSHISFSKKRSWVRHDDHYHVDFQIPCKK